MQTNARQLIPNWQFPSIHSRSYYKSVKVDFNIWQVWVGWTAVAWWRKECEPWLSLFGLKSLSDKIFLNGIANCLCIRLRSVIVYFDFCWSTCQSYFFECISTKSQCQIVFLFLSIFFTNKDFYSPKTIKNLWFTTIISIIITKHQQSTD